MHHTTRRIALTSLAALSLFTLVACGGGDDAGGGGTITATLEYPQNTTVNVLNTFTIVPIAVSAQGRIYTLSLTDETEKAPSWATIDPKTGVITGRMPNDRDTGLTVWMRVPNTTNPINTGVRLHGRTGITFSYDPPSQYLMNKPLSISPTVVGLEPGDVVQYMPNQESRPPAGVVFNPANGAFEGTPTQNGPFYLWATARVTRAGMTASFTARGGIVVRPF